MHTMVNDSYVPHDTPISYISNSGETDSQGDNDAA